MIRCGAVSRDGGTVCDSPVGEAVGWGWGVSHVFLMFLIMLCSLPQYAMGGDGRVRCSMCAMYL